MGASKTPELQRGKGVKLLDFLPTSGKELRRIAARNHFKLQQPPHHLAARFLFCVP